MGIINDGDEHLAGLMDFEGFLNEEAFAVMVLAIELDFKRMAKDAQDVVIGVECAVEYGCDNSFGIMIDEGVFENGFTGAGMTENETETALLSMNQEDVEDILLVVEQGDMLRIEGVLLETKMGTNHKE